MFWGKIYNKKKMKNKHNKEKNEKKGKKKEAKNRGETLQQESTIAINNIVWGPAVLSPHHLQFILLKKINLVQELVIVCLS